MLHICCVRNKLNVCLFGRWGENRWGERRRKGRKNRLGNFSAGNFSMHVISVTSLRSFGFRKCALRGNRHSFFFAAAAISYYSRLKIARGTLLKLLWLREFSTRTCGIDRVAHARWFIFQMDFISSYIIYYSYVIFTRYIWINNIFSLYFLYVNVNVWQF